MVVPGGDHVYRQEVRIEGAPLVPEAELVFADALPLRTVWCFYLGRLPAERHTGPRLTVTVYRVAADFTPSLNS